MSKRRLLLLSSGVLTALLLVSLVGVSAASAQDPTPEPKVVLGWRSGGRGKGGFGGGIFGWERTDQWLVFDAAAEALGLTPEELFTELHAGKSLEEIAEEQGVDIEAVQDAMNASRTEARRQAIEQAVEDGRITQEQADWMLEGLDKGYSLGGRGFGHGGRGPGGRACSEGE